MAVRIINNYYYVNPAIAPTVRGHSLQCPYNYYYHYIVQTI